MSTRANKATPAGRSASRGIDFRPKISTFQLFWATIKVEFYDGCLWPAGAAAEIAVGDCIERVYNRRGRH